MEHQLFKTSCYNPLTIKHESNYHTIPCGKCVKCYKRRISMWSFRLMQEDKHSLSSHFITLTYNNENVPITKKLFMTLDKRDIQLFMKRLRKDNKNKIKYYLCGEYGSQTKRPHYHAIMFNVDINTIQSNWNKGDIHIGQVSEASVGYTLKYMFKETRVPEHQNDDRLPEFSLMSKGLGINYLTNNMIRWHKEDLLNRVYLNILDGKKAAMPRYYKDRIYTREERGQIKSKYTEEYQKQLDNMLINPDQENIMKQIFNQKLHNEQKIKNESRKRKN